MPAGLPRIARASDYVVLFNALGRVDRVLLNDKLLLTSLSETEAVALDYLLERA